MTRRQKAKWGLVLLPEGIIISAFLLWLILVRPVYKIIQSRDWPQVECTIDSYQVDEAGIQQNKYGNSVRYRVSVQYSYQFGDKWYSSSRKSFEDGIFYSDKPSSVPRINKCYVNPKNPSEAVLFRNFQFYYLLLSVFPVFGLAGFAYGTYECLKTVLGYKKTI